MSSPNEQLQQYADGVFKDEVLPAMDGAIKALCHGNLSPWVVRVGEGLVTATRACYVCRCEATVTCLRGGRPVFAMGICDDGGV